MRTEATQASPRVMARIAGGFYLLNIVTILLAVFLFRGIVVGRDEGALRLGIAFELISTSCSIVVAAFFYELLRPVSRSVSLIAAFCRLIACVVAVVGYIFQSAPLVVSGAVGLLLYRLRVPATNIVIVFFGFHFVLLGYLIFRSGFLPRFLGVLAGLAGLGALTSVAPQLARPLFPYFVAIGLLTEVSLTVWLLAMGVDVERWNLLHA
jgi:hypothetical protein